MRRKVTLRVRWATAGDPDGPGDRIYNSADMLSEGFFFLDKKPKNFEPECKWEGHKFYYVDTKTMTVDGFVDG